MNANHHNSTSNLQTEDSPRANIDHFKGKNNMSEKIKIIVTVNGGKVTAVMAGLPLLVE